MSFAFSKSICIRLALILIAASLLLLISYPDEISAHDWTWCGDGKPVRWSGIITTHWYPDTWSSYYRTGISNSQTEFNKSDFDYSFFASETSALILWKDYNNSDTTIAGAARIYVPDCGTYIISSATLFYNFPHFNAATHTTAQYQCTAIHEMGHTAGYDHNTVTSILYKGHQPRCHSSLITTLQSHDFSDINGRY